VVHGEDREEGEVKEDEMCKWACTGRWSAPLFIGGQRDKWDRVN
jgi:hypothetical protein